jgi:hypothetical protein
MPGAAGIMAAGPSGGAGGSEAQFLRALPAGVVAQGGGGSGGLGLVATGDASGLAAGGLAAAAPGQVRRTRGAGELGSASPAVGSADLRLPSPSTARLALRALTPPTSLAATQIVTAPQGIAAMQAAAMLQQQPVVYMRGPAEQPQHAGMAFGVQPGLEAAPQQQQQQQGTTLFFAAQPGGGGRTAADNTGPLYFAQ